MSILFQESSSIRKTFTTELLEKIPGVCGIFAREMSGELFWLNGKNNSFEIDDPYMMPDDIKDILAKHG